MLLLNIYGGLFFVEGHQRQVVIIILLLSLHRIHLYLQQHKVPSFS